MYIRFIFGKKMDGDGPRYLGLNVVRAIILHKHYCKGF